LGDTVCFGMPRRMGVRVPRIRCGVNVNSVIESSACGCIGCIGCNGEIGRWSGSRRNSRSVRRHVYYLEWSRVPKLCMVPEYSNGVCVGEGGALFVQLGGPGYGKFCELP